MGTITSILSPNAGPGAITQALDMVSQIKQLKPGDDEQTVDELVVRFREWKTVEEPDEQGVMRKRNKSWVRTACIANFVPTDILLASIRFQMAARPSAELDLESQISWMQEHILMVWKLTEEDMTLERLRKGIDTLQTMELYFDFFGQTLEFLQNASRPQGESLTPLRTHD